MTDHPLADIDPLILENPNSISNNNNNNNDDDDDFVVSPDTNPTKPYLNITVLNPKKESSTSTYVTYLISTKTNIPDFAGTQFAVRRRFKDVVALSDRLAQAYRGFFIPPRPDKSLLESQLMQKHEFVEQRRITLEKYLHRLSQHPVIRQSDELRVFLQVQGNLPFMLDDGVTKHFPSKTRWDFRWIVNPYVSNDLEDAEFLQNKDRLLNLEKQLTNSSKQAQVFVKAQKYIAETMGAFGLLFIKLTKFENQHVVADTNRTRAADMKTLATAAIKSSRFYRELSSRTAKHTETLRDHMGLLLGVHTAVSDRSSALLTVKTLTSELNSLYSRAQKLERFGGDKLKFGEVKEAIRVTEDAKNCATNEYERIKGNNRSEIERLDRQRKVDLKDMLRGFVLNQVAFTEKIGIEWAKVAEETSGYAC